MVPSARERYTQALADFPDNQACVPLWLFWRPHLEKIVDLGAKRREYQAKREAAMHLACVFRMAYASRLRDHYASRQRSLQIKHVCQLRHNEIRRQLQPAHFVGLTENQRRVSHCRELIDYADMLQPPSIEPVHVASGDVLT